MCEAGRDGMSGEPNLRHLRLFAAVVGSASITRAAERFNLSQPAVTQAMAALERRAGAALLDRTRHGIFPTAAGAAYARRAARAMALLDAAADAAAAPRLKLTATAAQLRALIAVCEAGNFTLAARRLGCAQPTVHRAAGQLQKDVDRPLLARAPGGVTPTRTGAALARAAELMFAELAQAEAELAEAAGREVGRIVIGAMPLSRARLLPEALARFREVRPSLPVRVVDGPYPELLDGLRRGAIDFLLGALREPAPVDDVIQTALFDDSLALVARPGHPLAERAGATAHEVAAYPWIVNAPGTPVRSIVDRWLAAAGVAPRGVIETSSLVLTRELALRTDHIGCVSRGQAEAEVARGVLIRLPAALPDTRRPIGLTIRAGWEPTPAQADMIDLLRRAAAMA
jgi:DNA-binding transcriptional LysR family regulator